MIRCEGLTVQYGDFYALKNLSLSVAPHSACTVIGRSGSGKTTLLHALSGLKAPDSGRVTIHGELITHVRRGTSVVLQKDSLFPWKTVEQNLMLPLLHTEGKQLPRAQAARRISTTLEELGVLRHLHKYPAALSEGEKQRVAIARALIVNPDLLIMDEPTSALDAITKEAFQQQILRLQRHHGLTLVMVTHDIEEAVFLGQKIVVLNGGEVQAELSNDLFGCDNLRKQLPFYEKCIAVREVLEP